MRPRRRPVAALAALALLAVAGVTGPGTASAFSDRRLVIAIGEAGSAELEAVARLAAAARCRLADRDVDLVLVDAAELEALRAGSDAAVPERLRPALRARAPGATGFELVLVGKDGGVKARASSPDALESFLGRIDAMPMRRAEVRRAGGADLGC